MRGTQEHTFLFADLVGFTALTAIRGDEVAADVATSFHSEVARLAADHGAEAVKAIGDAVMVRGTDAAATVLLGLRIAALDEADGFPPVRVGMCTGPAVRRGGDWFGATVNLAARVAGLAGAGEVLLAETTRSALRRTPGMEIQARGLHVLKNVVAPLALYAAARLADELATPTALPTFPRSRVDATPAAAAAAA
jgi:adenylate cyclase